MLNRWGALRVPSWPLRLAGALLWVAAGALPLVAIAGSVVQSWWSAEVQPLRPEMVRIEPGSFTMGSPATEAGRGKDEAQHKVTITRAFWLARTEVTQEMYERVMGEAPFATEYKWVSLIGPALPAQNVSWEDAVRYCNRLSELEGLAPAYDLTTDPPTWIPGSEGYRLPTEAEWEFAARAGTSTMYVGTDAEAEVCARDNVADEAAKVWANFWVFPCDDGAPGLTVATATATSGWALYGLGGNVAEWVWDAYAADAPAGEDPVVSEGGYRVVRGGSWGFPPRFARVAYRGFGRPSVRDGLLGFRPARSLPP